jgi:hypothetical protein
MKRLSVLISLFCVFAALCVFAANEVGAQAGFCDCYGGIAADGSYWQLFDHEGNPLEDGDWVYAAWTGPDGEIDPPSPDGYPTDDDLLLRTATMEIEYSTFFITVTSWSKDDVDDEGNPKHAAEGELIYCRIFDGPQDSIGTGNYYADSQVHEVAWKLGDVLFCHFPGDPGQGHTDTPVPKLPVKSDSTASSSAESEPCGQK